MQYLKQSTAATVLVGPVLDLDGAAVTGAVIGDFRLAKNGTVSTMAGNTINHSHNGCYLIGLTTTDTNTLDRLSISVGNTSYSMTVFRYTVLESGMFDALITDGRILRSTNSNSSVLVTGSNHAAADVHAFQTDAIDAAAIAASAVTEIQSGLATTSNVSAVEAKVDTLLGRITSTLFSGITYMSRWLGAIAGKTADTTTRLEINATTGGASYNETTDSLEAIRDRGDAAWTSGSSSVTIAPLQATAPDRVAGTEIVTYINDTSDIGPIVVTDGSGDAVDLSSYTLKVCVELKSSGTINANITPTVSGAGNNQITFTPTSDCVSSTLPRKWSLRSTSDGQVFAFGDFTVEATARLS